MTYLEALGISLASISGISVILFYFSVAFTWAGDPHNYVKKRYRIRKYIGCLMIFFGFVFALSTLLFFSYEV